MNKLKNQSYRKIPKIDEVLNSEKSKDYIKIHSKVYLMDACNEVLNDIRNTIKHADEKFLADYVIDKDEIIDRIIKLAYTYSDYKLKKVVNATGIVIHTNMGRSLLSKTAVERALEISTSYNNLELNLVDGKRGSRYDHLESLITKITGAEACHIVNNNAAAVMLVLASMAKEREVIVSRSELVEIGGSFRVPDIMKLSQCKLVEVGCTNKTHLYDYENAITEDTAMILKVHTSNYKISGFTESQTVADLSRLSRERNIPLVEDIGSGSLVDLSKYGISDEPTVMMSLNSGADIVTFSGDKLLGGPQCGIIVGKKEYIDKMKKHQLTRAFRVDKVILSLLEATLKLYLDEEKAIDQIPTLRMITESKLNLLDRAKTLQSYVDTVDGVISDIVETDSEVGGGSLPTTTIKGYNVVLSVDGLSSEQLKTALREYQIPIIVRINDDKVLLDARTLSDDDFHIIKTALHHILGNEEK